MLHDVRALGIEDDIDPRALHRIVSTFSKKFKLTTASRQATDAR